MTINTATVEATISTSTDSGSSRSVADQSLRSFLESCPPPSKAWPRVKCCNSSRHLYCPICYRLLVPKDEWQPALRHPSFRLKAAKALHSSFCEEEEEEEVRGQNSGNLVFPFQLDVLLHDRRTSSTGLQAVCVLRAIQQSNSSTLEQQCGVEGDEETAKCESDATDNNNNDNQQTLHQAQIYDIKKGEIPMYDIEGEDKDGTYLLFPGPRSVPLSSVAPNVKKLVVLDCTWGHTGTRLLPTVAALPQVSLDANMLPLESYYWRWHNAGPGMLSTIEAVYFASWEITTHCGWTLEQRQELVYILWIFGMQRASIAERYANQHTHAPFTKEAKEKARKLHINENRGKNIANNQV